MSLGEDGADAEGDEVEEEEEDDEVEEVDVDKDDASAATAGAATADAAAAGAAAADAMLSQKLFDLRGRWTEDEGTDGGRAGEPLVPGASIAVRSALWCIQNPFKIPLAVY